MFQNHEPVRVFEDYTQRNSAIIMPSWRSSESNTHRYYINTSIHTYPVFARRINIVHLMRASRNPSACHGKRSNISGVEICLRESIESGKNRLILIWSKNVSFTLKVSRSALTKSPPRFFEKFARNS